MRVASCEPPPPALSAAEFTPPPPENLLLMISTVESFPDTRLFSLDQVIGCGGLYSVFLEFLKKGSLRTDRLYCIRKIDIYVELMTMQCEKEATEQAWHIYRYYIMQNAACQVIIHELERKRVMLSLAVLKKDIFEHTRSVAYNLLKEDFTKFTQTPEYIDLVQILREKKLNPLNRKKSNAKELKPLDKSQKASRANSPQPRKLSVELPGGRKSSIGDLFANHSPPKSPKGTSDRIQSKSGSPLSILSSISGALKSAKI